MSKFHPDVTILNSNQDTDPKKLHEQFHDDTSKRLTFRAITSKKFTDGRTDRWQDGRTDGRMSDER